MFIMPFDSKDVIVKIGYSFDIIERSRTLRIEYGCSQIFLIGLKVIYGKSDYNRFCTTLDKFEKEDVMIRDKQKHGLYKLSELLMNEFNAFDGFKKTVVIGKPDISEDVMNVLKKLIEEGKLSVEDGQLRMDDF